MQIRPIQPADLDQLADIDGTIESTQYLHVGQSGDDTALTWSLESRPLRGKLIEPNPIDDDLRFMLKQIVTGVDEATALVAEHQEQVVALLAARPVPSANLLHIQDLRVDYDMRRQGLASAMLFQAIQSARESGLRAIRARSLTNNAPASALLAKLGFELSGVDTRRNSNHDLVKESVTLFWYLCFD